MDSIPDSLSVRLAVIERTLADIALQYGVDLRLEGDAAEGFRLIPVPLDE